MKSKQTKKNIGIKSKKKYKRNNKTFKKQKGGLRPTDGLLVKPFNIQHQKMLPSLYSLGLQENPESILRTNQMDLLENQGVNPNPSQQTIPSGEYPPFDAIQSSAIGKQLGQVNQQLSINNNLQKKEEIYNLFYGTDKTKLSMEKCLEVFFITFLYKICAFSETVNRVEVLYISDTILFNLFRTDGYGNTSNLGDFLYNIFQLYKEVNSQSIKQPEEPDQPDQTKIIDGLSVEYNFNFEVLKYFIENFLKDFISKVEKEPDEFFNISKNIYDLIIAFIELYKKVLKKFYEKQFSYDDFKLNLEQIKETLLKTLLETLKQNQQNQKIKNEETEDKIKKFLNEKRKEFISLSFKECYTNVVSSSNKSNNQSKTTISYYHIIEVYRKLEERFYQLLLKKKGEKNYTEIINILFDSIVNPHPHPHPSFINTTINSSSSINPRLFFEKLQKFIFDKQPKKYMRNQNKIFFKNSQTVLNIIDYYISSLPSSVKNDNNKKESIETLIDDLFLFLLNLFQGLEKNRETINIYSFINNKSLNNTKKKLLLNDNYLELCNQIINTLVSFLRRFIKNGFFINQKMRNLKEELKKSKIHYTNNGRKLYNLLPLQISQPSNEIGSLKDMKEIVQIL